MGGELEAGRHIPPTPRYCLGQSESAPPRGRDPPLSLRSESRTSWRVHLITSTSTSAVSPVSLIIPRIAEAMCRLTARPRSSADGRPTAPSSPVLPHRGPQRCIPPRRPWHRTLRIKSRPTGKQKGPSPRGTTLCSAKTWQPNYSLALLRRAWPERSRRATHPPSPANPLPRAKRAAGRSCIRARWSGCL